MGKITDIIAIIKAIIELLKLIGSRRTAIALQDKCRDCRAVAAEMREHRMSVAECRQYEEEKYRD